MTDTEQKTGPLRQYWRIYGGVPAMLRSGYFRASVLLTVVLFPLWWKPNWWDLVFSVTPGMLGFAIGGFAIFASFGGEKFIEVIAGVDQGKPEPSPYMQFASAFMHFIVVGFVAILFALVAKAAFEEPQLIPTKYEAVSRWAGRAFWFLGFVAFMYGMATALAAAAQVFRLTRSLDRAQTLARTRK